MDDLTLIRSFRAERADDDPRARTAAWQALQARLESAPATPVPITTAARRRRLLPRRRHLLAFAGAAVAAAAVAGVLVLGSGPTAQPAAAEILHKTAAVAASPDAPPSSPLPGPGQFLYEKVKRLELLSWNPDSFSSGSEPAGCSGCLLTGPNAAGAFTALQPTTQESWTAPDGAGRHREVAGSPRFLTHEEQARWEAAGSRLPAPFDPEYQRKYPLAFGNALEVRRGVVDTEHESLKNFHFPDTSSLPTEPEALRRAVESNQISVGGFNLMYPSAKRLDTKRTIAELFNILQEGNPSAQLRAAAFNALAELPGIEVNTGSTDFLGRRGDAIRSVDSKTGGGMEFIFDPNTSAMLAERTFLGDREPSPYRKGLPAGLTLRETAYLETGVADSTHETAAEAEAEGRGPVATTSEG